MESVGRGRVTLNVRASRLMGVVFPFCLILSQYKYLSINFGFFFFSVISSVLLFGKRTFDVVPAFILFIFCVFFSLSVSVLVHGGLFHGTLTYYVMGIVLVFNVILLSSSIDITSLYFFYKLLAVLITLVVFVQGVVMMVFSVELAPIKILPVGGESLRLWEAEPRPSGVFTEPQLYASFVLPLLVLALINRERLVSLFLILGIMVSGSTYGLAIAACLLIWYNMKIRNLFSFTYLFGMAIFSVCVIAIYLYSSLFDSAIEKVLRTDLSEGIRVGKALFVFWEMSSLEKLVGLGVSVGDYVKMNVNNFPWLLPYVVSDSHLLDYVNGMFGLAIHFGVLPMFVFVWFLISVYQRGSKFQKGMVIILFLHSMSATFLFNGYFLFFFSLLFAGSINETSNIRKVRLSL